MLDIAPVELGLFFKQLGLSVAGASALWGLWMSFVSKRSFDKEKSKVFAELSKSLLLPLGIGVLVAMLGWTYLLFLEPISIFAHEGVVIESADHNNVDISGITAVFFGLLALVSVAGFRIYRSDKEKFKKNIRKFYGAQLVIASVLVSFPVWRGSFDAQQIFLIGHNFHSILTIGTVIVLDFIFFASESLERIKKHLYPFLPNVSKVIWVGLGIEFTSVFLIFGEALALTPKFFFAQTIIAILIINGAFLAGPMSKKLIASVSGSKVKNLSKGWVRAEGVAGVISISSWGTVTFIDFLKDVTAPYWQLAVFYIGLLIVVYGIYMLIEKTRPRL